MARRVKLFDFENPASFQAGLNEFTAPAGAFAYHGVEYFIVLSDFGASLSINETSSNNEDAGGETGATLADSAGGDTNVLRLAVKGSRRDSGILVSNFAQPGEGDQEIISVGDKCCFTMDVGECGPLPDPRLLLDLGRLDQPQRRLAQPVRAARRLEHRREGR